MRDLSSVAQELVREQGGRMTSQRRLILETLEDIGGHPTAEDLYQAVQQLDRTINPSTVYRTLGWLAEHGLVQRRQIAPATGSRNPEHFDPHYPSEHHHFVCTHCGKVIEFASQRVEQAKAELARSSGLVVERSSLTMYGICRECLDAGAGSDVGTPGGEGTPAAGEQGGG